MTIRLHVTTNWDLGFQRRPGSPPLDDLLPGDEYVVECTAIDPGMLGSVVIRDFALDRLYIERRFVPIVLADRTAPAGAVDDRTYQIDPAVPVAAGEKVRAILKNKGIHPKKPKVAMLIDEAQETPPTAAWSVEGVHVGTKSKPIAPSCPTCDGVDRDRRRVADGKWCSDPWHGDARPIFLPVTHGYHVPKIARTLHEGPGNATLVRGCSCGADVENALAFAVHVNMPEHVVARMLGLVGVIYDLVDHPGQVTREEAASRVARCLEFTP